MSSFCAYRALNLSKTATTKQIKQAWFDIAKLTHPDSAASGGVNKKEVFLDASRAYELLKTPEKRRLYDAQAALNRRPASPPQPPHHYHPSQHKSHTTWSSHRRNSGGYTHTNAAGGSTSTAYEDYANNFTRGGGGGSGGGGQNNQKPISNGMLSFSIIIAAIVGNLAYASFIRHKWEQTRHLLDTNDKVLHAEWERAKSTSRDRRIKLEQRAVKEEQQHQQQMEINNPLRVADKKVVVMVGKELGMGTAVKTNSAAASSTSYSSSSSSSIL